MFSDILEHLGVVEAAAQAHDTRISLVQAGAVAILLARLKLCLEEDEQRREEICRVLGALLLGELSAAPSVRLVVDKGVGEKCHKLQAACSIRPMIKKIESPCEL